MAQRSAKHQSLYDAYYEVKPGHLSFIKSQSVSPDWFFCLTV
ncbi:hypothetical protein ALTERO38_60463 [Alteromonas sp. 38]|nr:hypothetical protein ALTER154_40332 [Alteromonas sp. 154]VXC22414.1 hypothetical protein ALTERO38_60463 [Alteromonas sp. 38]